MGSSLTDMALAKHVVQQLSQQFLDWTHQRDKRGKTTDYMEACKDAVGEVVEDELMPQQQYSYPLRTQNAAPDEKIDGSFWLKHVIPKMATYVALEHNTFEICMNKNRPHRVGWFAVGDWGEWSDPLELLAKRMAVLATSFTPSFVMALGDNFYPTGALKPGDAEFRMWEKVFIEKYPTLYVPWKVVLGNHDYMGNPQCQIDFTTHEANPKGLWQMPSNQYSWSMPCGPNGETIAFIAFDSNAVQFSVRNTHPHRLEEYPKDLEWLKAELTKHKDATWKVYFAHHPFYTKGKGHLNEARCLRSRQYENVAGTATYPGMDLEKVLVEHGVDAVFSGHEHIMQQHKGKGDILHFVSGATVESHWYKGRIDEEPMDWYLENKTGFIAADVSSDPSSGESELRVRFVDSTTGHILHQVSRVKKVAKPQEQQVDAPPAPAATS